MARKKEVPRLRQYIAFDPGSTWTGMCILSLYGQEAFAITAVFNQGLLFPAEWLKAYLEDRMLNDVSGEILVLSEEFRIRPKRYETFASGETLQLLGALRYVAGEYAEKGVGFSVRPSMLIPFEEMHSTPLYTFLQHWKQEGDWPNKGARPWEHAMSAWRVFLHYSLMDDWQDVRQQRIFKADNIKKIYFSSGDTHAASFGITGAYVSPMIHWRW